MSGLAASMLLVALDAAMANLAGSSIREGLGLRAAQLAVGLGLGLVNATALALRDTGDGEGEVLSGLINATQQRGGAIELAALAGLAIGAAGAGSDVSFTIAFLGAAALVLLALVPSLAPTSSRESVPTDAQAP